MAFLELSPTTSWNHNKQQKETETFPERFQKEIHSLSDALEHLVHLVFFFFIARKLLLISINLQENAELISVFVAHIFMINNDPSNLTLFSLSLVCVPNDEKKKIESNKWRDNEGKKERILSTICRNDSIRTIIINIISVWHGT